MIIPVTESVGVSQTKETSFFYLLCFDMTRNYHSHEEQQQQLC